MAYTAPAKHGVEHTGSAWQPGVSNCCIAAVAVACCCCCQVRWGPAGRALPGQLESRFRSKCFQHGSRGTQQPGRCLSGPSSKESPAGQPSRAPRQAATFIHPEHDPKSRSIYMLTFRCAQDVDCCCKWPGCHQQAHPVPSCFFKHQCITLTPFLDAGLLSSVPSAAAINRGRIQTSYLLYCGINDVWRDRFGTGQARAAEMPVWHTSFQNKNRSAKGGPKACSYVERHCSCCAAGFSSWCVGIGVGGHPLTQPDPVPMRSNAAAMATSMWLAPWRARKRPCVGSCAGPIDAPPREMCV